MPPRHRARPSIANASNGSIAEWLRRRARWVGMVYRDEMTATRQRLDERQRELTQVRAALRQLRRQQRDLEEDIELARTRLGKLEHRCLPWRVRARRYRWVIPAVLISGLVIGFLIGPRTLRMECFLDPPAKHWRSDAVSAATWGGTEDVRWLTRRAVATTLDQEPEQLAPWLERAASSGLTVRVYDLGPDHFLVTWVRQLGSPEPGAIGVDVYERGPTYWDPIGGYD